MPKKQSEDKTERSWHLLDANAHILGRLSTQAARFLMGKDKPEWVPYLDRGDYVVVVNAAKVAVTGKKESQKRYFRYSGYPSGLKSETLGDLRKRRPGDIIRHAVLGMLPDNKIGRKMIIRLFVYPGEEGEMVARATASQVERTRPEVATRVGRDKKE
ncbi:50S ribosomal protein L13 [candidate division WWE3 bacterium RIFCSPLOWO2_02_FULL_53_10]|uniref:Large ribosomal subunit protein uL13 n=1 Tax=candidate division WWE3 bacterium RIFCSPLOWO2_02_FULL_53_10 TaxID=1802629 RepID=A0A1F4WC00_UNCKA|nr:MAG: 50S ribosomal protein L13 [candidate division WWE3 bacterium RIFCSPLOWO2_02_FULL_53_10]